MFHCAHVVTQTFPEVLFKSWPLINKLKMRAPKSKYTVLPPSDDLSSIHLSFSTLDCCINSWENLWYHDDQRADQGHVHSQSSLMSTYFKSHHVLCLVYSADLSKIQLLLKACIPASTRVALKSEIDDVCQRAVADITYSSAFRHTSKRTTDELQEMCVFMPFTKGSEEKQIGNSKA